jgi:hypothetical protein
VDILSRRLTKQTDLFSKMLTHIKRKVPGKCQYLFVDNHPDSKLESMGLKYRFNIFPTEKDGVVIPAQPIFLVPDKSEFWDS